MSLSIVARTLLVAAMLLAGCSSVQRCADRSRRYAAYKRQLAGARNRGTRADLQAAFPSLRISATPMDLWGMPLCGTEYYYLDSDFILRASFLYMDVRTPIRLVEVDELLFGHPASTTYPLRGIRPFIHQSPKDHFTGYYIERRDDFTGTAIDALLKAQTAN